MRGMQILHTYVVHVVKPADSCWAPHVVLRLRDTVIAPDADRALAIAGMRYPTATKLQILEPGDSTVNFLTPGDVPSR